MASVSELSFKLFVKNYLKKESRVQSPASRVQSPESRVQSPESRVQSPESRVQSPESRVQSNFYPMPLRHFLSVIAAFVICSDVFHRLIC